MTTQRNDLAHCRALIEARLGWGAASGWQNRDFERLSEQIFEETHVSLSPSTLKRVWGRVRYESFPTATTLDALARFAGFPNYRRFQQATARVPDDEPDFPVSTAPPPPGETTPQRRAWRWPVVVVGGMLLLLTGVWAFRKLEKPLRYGSVTFTSQPVAVGIPNTVLFRYDATDSNADSVFIQQSWDPRRRFRVDKQRHEYASTYYTPGYFRAKLVLNDSVVREHDLYLRSEGWLGTLDRDPIPVYFKNTQRPGGSVGLSEADLKTQQVDFGKEIPWTSLFNVQDVGGMSSDDFTFETRLRSTFSRGDAVCQRVYIVLLCSEGRHLIPLSVKGCVGELALAFSENTVSGKTSDLSGFGVNFSDWVRVRCDVRQRKVRVFVNEKLAYAGQFRVSSGKVVGLRYRFHGTGEVASAEFRRADGSGTKRLL